MTNKDVFLCHNSKEKQQVEKIREKLKQRGILAWLDKYDFEPFRPWQRQLEEIITQIKAVAVFIGSSGSGPWEDIEMQGFLNEFAKRKLRMGLVILPDCPENIIETVPRFINIFQWVDFRQNEPDAMNQLIWGITGINPLRRQEFLKIYSYSHEDERTDNSTVIVIPAFKMEKVELPNHSTSNNDLKQKAIENISRSNTKVAIKNDVIASSFIESSFLENSLFKPQLKWDVDEINFTGQEKKTYILIGLSNNQVNILNHNNSIPGKYFYISTSEIDNYHSFIINCGHFDNSNYLCPPGIWNNYSFDHNYNYAVFAKFEYENNKIIVCGGITGTCTSRLALYVSENLEHIYSELQHAKRGSLEPNDSFAVVIQIPIDEQSQDIFIRETCIKRIA